MCAIEMGQVLEGMSPFTYEHWMPDEEPTFYIPVSHPLSPRQMLVLAEAGIRPGEPFILTNDGRLSRPESKKMALRGWYDSFTIKKGSTNLYEEEDGKFSLEFQYFAPLAVEIEVRLSVKDASDGTSIRYGRVFDRYFKLLNNVFCGVGRSVTQRSGVHSPSHLRHLLQRAMMFQQDSAERQLCPVDIPNGPRSDTIYSLQMRWR